MAKHDGRVLYFVGKLDHLVTSDQRVQLSQALSVAAVRHEIVVYPGVKHGFFCEERNTFDEAARDDSWRRVCSMFQEELKS